MTTGTITLLKCLSAQIKERREKKEWSLRELARQAEISASTMSDIEGGRENPRISVVYRIADALNCKVDDLLKEEGD